MRGEPKYCPECGKKLPCNRHTYCSDECRKKAYSKKMKEVYRLKKDENSKEFQDYLSRNRSRSTEKYLAHRKKQCYEYAKKIMKLHCIDDVARFLDRNCRFKHGG